MTPPLPQPPLGLPGNQTKDKKKTDPNKLIHSADKYGSFFPTVTEAYVNDGINAILAVCCVSDNNTLSGEFRVAMKSNTDLKLPLNLECAMGENPFPDLKFSFPTAASDLKFMNNRWHTEWYSLQEELEAGHISIEKLVADNEAYVNLVNRVKRVLVLSDRARDCCFRLEVGCPANSDELDLNIRWLPASATFLKNHSRLNSGDVATINGGCVQIFTSIFPKSMRDRLGHFPLAPTIFVDHEMGSEDYAVCVLEYFPSILAGIRGFQDLSFQDAKKYVRSPSAHSGNVQRFKCKRKQTIDHSYAATQHASGFSSSQPPGYGLINDQESNSSLNQLLNLAREEVGQQISHYVGNSQHSNSAPSVIQAHTNTQSNKQLGQTNSSVIKELREFLSDYSRRNNQSMGPSPVTIDDQQTIPDQINFPANLSTFSQKTSVIKNSSTKRYKRDEAIIDQDISDDVFKKQFPNLVPASGKIPESYYYLTFAEATLENVKRDKGVKKSSCLEDKLKDNHLSVHLEKSWDKNICDNLKSKLHPIRFDRAPTISSEELFVQAAHYFEENELLPINSYDLSRLDLTNKITAKGFEELHKPDSRLISIKMFSPENVKKSNGGISNINVINDDGGNQTVLTSMYLEDIENIKHFQIAFFALKTAKSRVVPWDGSLEPLWKFFIVHDWLKDMPNSFGYNSNQDQGTFCSTFTDSVLHTNAIRFSQKQSHMSYADLDSHFRSFCSYNPKCSYVQMIPYVENKTFERKAKPTQNNSVDTSEWTPSAPGSTFIHYKSICKNYNSDKGCSNKFDSKTRRCSDLAGGGKFLHICNIKIPPNNRPCGQSHTNKNHSKK